MHWSIVARAKNRRGGFQIFKPANEHFPAMASASVLQRRWNRWLIFILSCVQVFTSAGIIFGWASLLIILKDAGVYASLCSSGTTLASCTQRDQALQLIFTFASSMNMIANLTSGLVMDRYGPRACKLLSHACIIGGSILIAAWNDSRDYLVLPGMTLIGYGGTGLQLASIHISNLFPSGKSLATCVIVGNFQLSFFVFFIFNDLYQAGTSLHTIFFWYAVLNVANFAITVVFEPTTPFRLPSDTGAPGIALEKAEDKGGESVNDSIVVASGKDIGVDTGTVSSINGAATTSIPANTPAPIPARPGLPRSTPFAPPSGLPSELGRFSMIRLPSVFMHAPSPGSLLTASPATPQGHTRMRRDNARSAGASMVAAPSGTGTGTSAGTGTGMQAQHGEGAPLLEHQITQTMTGACGGSCKGRHPKDLSQRSFRSQIQTTTFLQLLFFFSISTLWANFFVGTISSQLGPAVTNLSTTEYSYLINAFNVLLPAAVVGIPVIGWLLDTRGFVVSIFLTIALGLLFAVGLLVANPKRHPGLLIAAFCCYALFRTFLFSVTFAYVGQKFGFRHFGALSGVLFFVAAAIGYLQYPINSWGAYMDINVIQLVCLLCTLSFPCHEWLLSRREKQHDGYDDLVTVNEYGALADGKGTPLLFVDDAVETPQT